MSVYNPASSMAKAMHAALSADIELQSYLGPTPRLYDAAPEDPIYPYMTYGAARTEDVSGDETPLTSHTLSLHIWSRYGGRAEVLEILGAVRRVVESAAIAPEGGHLISGNVLYADSFRAGDGRTLHGIIRVNFRTQPLDQTLSEVA